jgi:hypothetical protein
MQGSILAPVQFNMDPEEALKQQCLALITSADKASRIYFNILLMADLKE